jgi:4-hydroxy-tetrahydrodipicolinate synthase
VEYLRAVAEAADVPLVLYNFPRHTGNALTPEILAQVPHFGMKDSSGDQSLIPCTPRYFLGDDAHIVQARRAGAAGFVSAAANAAPGLYVALERAALQQRWAQAEGLQEQVNELHGYLRRPEVASLKRLMAGRIAHYPAAVRPPLVALPTEPNDGAAEAGAAAWLESSEITDGHRAS